MPDSRLRVLMIEDTLADVQLVQRLLARSRLPVFDLRLATDLNQGIKALQASPFDALAWGRCTMRADGDTTRLYLHVFDWPKDGRLVVPGLGNEIEGARLLAAPGSPLVCETKESNVAIRVPASAPDAICSVIALEVSGAPIVYRTPKILADSEVLVRPLSVRIEAGSPETTAAVSLFTKPVSVAVNAGSLSP